MSKGLFQIRLQELKQLEHKQRQQATIEEEPLQWECLCSSIKPLFLLSQYLGITPVTIDRRNHHKAAAVPAAALGIGQHKPQHTFHGPPVSRGSYENSSDDRTCCTLHQNSLSVPNLINTIFCILYLVSTAWSYKHIRHYVKPYFEKTDLYAFEFKIFSTLATATVILIYYKSRKGALVKYVKGLSICWNALQGVTSLAAQQCQHTLLTTQGDPKNSRYHGHGYIRWSWDWNWLYSINAFMATSIALLVLNVGLQIGLMIAGLGCTTGHKPSMSMVLCYFVSGITLNVHYQTSAAIFAMFCLISRALHIKLGQQLRELFPSRRFSTDSSEPSTNNNNRRHGHGGGGGPSVLAGLDPSDRYTYTYSKLSCFQLEQIRLIHIGLVHATKGLSNFFGIPVLCICCNGVIIITCGIYNFIFSDNEGSYEITMKTVFYGGFLMEMYFAVLTIGTILVSGQMLSNSVTTCIEILHESSLLNLDPKSEFQVLVYLQSIKSSNGKLTACNMTNIGAAFLASAATNTTTYILVLLQFRLGGSPGAAAAALIDANNEHGSSTNDSYSSQ